MSKKAGKVPVISDELFDSIRSRINLTEDKKSKKKIAKSLNEDDESQEIKTTSYCCGFLFLLKDKKKIASKILKKEKVYIDSKNNYYALCNNLVQIKNQKCIKHFDKNFTSSIK